MKSLLTGLTAGLLFGLGVTVSAMISPAKVLGFLDLAGSWDPSLALVMAAAIPVFAVAYALSRRRQRPLFDNSFALPTARSVDAPLVGGAALFGIGWGLSGFCPGPALASLGLAAVGVTSPTTWTFVAAMVAGMLIYDLWQRFRA